MRVSRLTGLMALLALLVSVPVGAREKPWTLVEGADWAPEPGKALVVFLRPSSYGGLIKTSVYEVRDSDQAFIGIVAQKTRIAWQADPGQTRFMIVGENADFMEATLEADKTYYVLVSPRVGVWKARFSLLPIRTDAAAEHNVHSEEFSEWMGKSKPIVRTASAEAWYAKHRASIDGKREKYLRKWDGMLPEDKAELTLHATDGT